jgi:hypothetical protein
MVNSPPFAEPECPLPFPQKLANDSCPEPIESSLHRHTLFPENPFDFIPPLLLGASWLNSL